MKKFALSMLLSCSYIVTASTSASSTETAAQIAVLEKQIATLQKQLVEISKQVKAQQAMPEKQVVVEKVVIKEVPVKATSVSAQSNQPSQTSAPDFGPGYLNIPGNPNAAVKFSGLIKLSAIMDGKNYSGEQTNPARLPYNLQLRNNQTNTAYTWRKHLYMQAKQSRFGIEPILKTSSGKNIKGKFEADFFGSSQFGDTFPGQAVNGPATVSTTYLLRLRHAYIDYNGWLVGHTTNTFALDEISSLPAVDLNSVMLGHWLRHAIVRYTHNLGNLDISAAVEHPRGDYVTYNSAPGTNPNYIYNPIDSGTNHAKPTRPDVVLRFQYTFDNKNKVGISFISRDIRIKYNPGTGLSDGQTYDAPAYGMTLATKIMLTSTNYVTAGWIVGRGLGGYIQEMNGRSAILSDISNTAPLAGRTYKSLPMQAIWAGYSHNWTPEWQTNLGAAYSELQSKAGSTKFPVNYFADPGLDLRFVKYSVNTIYKFEDQLEVGLEFMYIQRFSTLGYKGEANRYQLGISYKF